MASAGLWTLAALAAAAPGWWWPPASCHQGAASCTAACLRQCWQNCGPLQANRSLWGTLCAADPACAGMCRQLCRNAATSSPPPPRGASAPGAEWLTRLLAVVAQPGGSVRPRMPSSAPSRRSSAKLWPTLVEVEAPPPSSQDAAGVVLVDPGGSGGVPGVDHLSDPAVVFRGRGASYEVTYGDVWSVGVASVTQQGVLVFAELSWRAPEDDMAAAWRGGGSPLYLVTWEVDGGGITGNLYTDSSCVTLSLWADTVFHIQVELVRHSVAISRSGRLRIDTAGHRSDAAGDGGGAGEGDADADVDAPLVERLRPRDAWFVPVLPNAAVAAAFFAVACWRVRRRHRQAAAAKNAAVSSPQCGTATVKPVGAKRLPPVGPDDLCV
ncbi:uncharacterized protein LOC124804728 [Schistocerca piceifrons]|uniref:uncharacterized protein LOC124804728 n=1 Tax=Schistocerca piceifrons TaxID=274613 RepID=UPI001F5EEE47|nr:uncharacterized protein LOC124804728 [Schistocerca piceifrons]